MFARIVDKQVPHYDSRRSQKMTATIPAGIVSSESQIRFMHYCGRIQRVIGPLGKALEMSQPLQLGINQFDQFGHGAVVAFSHQSQQVVDIRVVILMLDGHFLCLTAVLRTKGTLLDHL